MFELCGELTPKRGFQITANRWNAACKLNEDGDGVRVSQEVLSDGVGGGPGGTMRGELGLNSEVAKTVPETFSIWHWLIFKFKYAS